MRDADFNWLAEQPPEFFDRYAGKWIAVRDKAVIAEGDTATEVDAKARQQAGDGEFILEAVDQRVDVIYGCL
jgi:hypothetical protein